MSNSFYHFYVSSTANLDKVFKNINILNDCNFEIQITKEEVTKVVSKLIDKKIDIYAIYPKMVSLEEVFMKKTGGNTID